MTNPEIWEFQLGGLDAQGRPTGPYPKPPLSMNDRMHFQKEARIKRDLRVQLDAALRRARVPKGADHVTVQLLYRPGSRRAQDPDNLGKTTKTLADVLQPHRAAYLDRKGRPHAAVIGYGLIPDDTARHCSRPEAILLDFAGKDRQAWWVRLIIRRTTP